MQECDCEFVLTDLNVCMPNFKCLFLEKSSLTNEGEALLIRNDKLKFVKSFDINLAQKFRTSEDLKLLRNFLNENQVSMVFEKGNVLQVKIKIKNGTR